MIVGFVKVECIMSLMKEEYVVIYVSVDIVGGLAKYTYWLKIGSLQSHQFWSGFDRRF